MKKLEENKTLLVRLSKSTIGCTERQKACVRGLGLRKRNHQVEVADTMAIRGMINRVSFLLTVQEKN